MKKIIATTIVLGCAAVGAVEITDVTAKQRWPWNNLVDVDFNLDAVAGEHYRVELEAKCADGTKYFSAKTLKTDPVVMAGENRVTWDFGADYPGIRAEDMRFSVSVVPAADADKPLYMVVDLSGGTEASKFPVRYTNIAPKHTIGATNEPCQTTELWLRRISAPKSAFSTLYFKVDGYNGDVFYSRLTKDYYIGIFELTQKQYALISGKWPSFRTRADCRDSRPVEQVSFTAMAGTYEDPVANPGLITDTSALGVLRSKTGLPMNLPTLAQLQYAALGGSTPLGAEVFRYYVNGAPASSVAAIARYNKNVGAPDEADSPVECGSALVGSYLPNDYGIYDLLGNLWEVTSSPALSSSEKKKWQLYYQGKANDNTLGLSAANPVVDPTGCAVSEAVSDGKERNLFGGAFDSDATLWLTGTKVDVGDWRARNLGYRIVMTVE